MKIKLTGTRENKSTGFYHLMLSFPMSSYKLDEFYVEGTDRKIKKLLKKYKIEYKTL